MIEEIRANNLEKITNMVQARIGIYKTSIPSKYSCFNVLYRRTVRFVATVSFLLKQNSFREADLFKILIFFIRYYDYMRVLRRE